MGQMRHVLVHEATPVVALDDAAVEWVEGEPGSGPEPVYGPEFPCVLFLPLGTEDEAQPRARKMSRPTLLWEPWDLAGAPLAALSADAELLIAAPELAGSFEQAEGWPAGTGRWQVEGAPQPFGPPGTVIGYQATLKQVGH